MNPVASDILMHYGVKRRSGRYPWGSGENPYQHSGDFLSAYEEYEKLGMSETEIARAMKMKTSDLRIQLRVAKHERRELQAARARSLRDDGKSLNEIASIMGFKNDSSVRSLLNENTANNKSKAKLVAEKLKEELEAKGALDVGENAEITLGVSRGVLDEALFMLETEGYSRFGVGVPNATDPSKRTTNNIIAKPDISQNDVYNDYTLVKSLGNYHSDDGGETFNKLEYPASVDSKRVMVRYGDQGGSDLDGVIQLRRGVPDLDLGNSHYAQVRILVDGTHYLKGMAMYADDLPPGVDICFNTNKKSGTPKMDVLKPISDKDPDNPFGAEIKANGQSWYDAPDGTRKLSAVNKLKEEGDWDRQAKNISSQFLSKQRVPFIRQQLNLTYADYAAEYDEICSLTNPTVKRNLLRDFADECDSAAVHMKAAALPGQSSKVLIPMPHLKDTEVYAPTYKDGQQLALVRYPHAGTFEIPILTVNNRGKKSREILDPSVQDAIGINKKTADKLSGADFDGDSVVAIPLSDKVKIKADPTPRGLRDFDTKTAYPPVRDADGNVISKVMSKGAKQKQMGEISNLITDMTLKGAPMEEIVRAVKHSMVVIDAPKHELDYKRSERENGIDELKKTWQGVKDESGKEKGGASTLLSRRKQEVEIPETQGSGRIDKNTGKVIYKQSGRTFVDKKTGAVREATDKVSIVLNTDDVRKLSSGTPQENLYADHANRLKALANQARMESAKTSGMKRNPSAAAAYSDEVDSLNAKLRLAKLNAPREREAQRLAGVRIKAKTQDNEGLSKDDVKKIRSQEIARARAEVGATGKKTRVTVTDREWEAIQAGAVSSTTLEDIMRYSDKDKIRERALPKATKELSSAKQSKIRAMRASGYTVAEIAQSLGISPSSVSKYS